MSQNRDEFRDFGIFPQQLPPPPEHVRCFLSPGRIIGQYLGVGTGLTIGLGLAALLALTNPFPLNWLGAAATLAGFGALIYLVTRKDYRWIELDGQNLYAKHLYTGQIVVRGVDEIDSLVTMVYQHRTVETALIETILGRVKGVEVRFHDRRTPLRIMRADPAMTNAKELIEAILCRMAQLRNIDAEVIHFAGAPLVRCVHWKGQKPAATSGKLLKLNLCCLILMGLLSGSILGFWGRQEHRRQSLSSVPPQQVTLQELINTGAAADRHISVTELQFGGYVIETNNGSWSRVWIALFPKADAANPVGKQLPPRSAIKAILESSTVNNEAELGQFLKRGLVTGFCSAPRTNFGITLGPELVKANPGSHLDSAYVIEDSSDPPSATLVWRIFAGSTASLMLVIVSAFIVFMKER